MTSPANSQELGSQLAYVRGSQNSQPLELLHSDTTKDIFVALSTDEKCVSLSMGYSKPWGQFNSSGIESLHTHSVLFSLLTFSLHFSAHLHTKALNHRSVQLKSSEDEDGIQCDVFINLHVPTGMVGPKQLLPPLLKSPKRCNTCNANIFSPCSYPTAGQTDTKLNNCLFVLYLQSAWRLVL